MLKGFYINVHDRKKDVLRPHFWCSSVVCVWSVGYGWFGL